MLLKHNTKITIENKVTEEEGLCKSQVCIGIGYNDGLRSVCEYRVN